MAVVTTDLRPLGEGNGGVERTPGAVGLCPRQNRAPVVRAVACLALRFVTEIIVVLLHPVLGHWMHAMRPTRSGGGGSGHAHMAGSAFHHRAGMALDGGVAEVVISMGAGKLRVR